MIKYLFRYTVLIVLSVVATWNCSRGISGGIEVGNPNCVVSGLVTDSTGKSISCADVYLALKGGNPIEDTLYHTRSSSDGSFILELPKNVYALTTVDSSSGDMAFLERLKLSDETFFVDTISLTDAANIDLVITRKAPGSRAIYVPSTPFYTKILGDTVHFQLPAGKYDFIEYDISLQSVVDTGINYIDVNIASGESKFIFGHIITTPTIPNGPDSVKISDKTRYVSGDSKSSFGHSLEYRFRWVKYEGQSNYWDYATYEEWSSDTSIVVSWSVAGEYKIEAQARSLINSADTSEWSNYKEIIVYSLNQ